MVTVEMTPPVMSAGLASGMMTFQMMRNVDAPMDCAASMTPASTSLAADSTMRATYGAAAMTSVTITARLPRLVPTTNFATGSMATMRMMNGMLRRALTMMPSVRLSQPMGWMPSRSVMRRMRPTGRPMR